jgi:DNA-binding GntR family transcriptional regulator
MRENVVRRSVLADQVKDHLLEDILSGRYPPHSRIVETQVARELGTSQAPVREALRGLEAIGVVDILPFRGARVRRPATDEILEAIELRAELESFGARRSVPRLSPEDVQGLTRSLETMQRAAAAGDRHELAEADAAFHARLIALSGNATLERLWRSLEPFARTYLTSLVPGVDVRWTAELHVPIVRALQGGDVDEVVAAIRAHFDEAGAKIREGWTEDDAPPSGEG